MENLIYILLAIAYVLIQLVARRSRRPPVPPASPTDYGEPPPIKPPPSVLEPEEELRRFLRELAGDAAEGRTPPRPPAPETAPMPPPPLTSSRGRTRPPRKPPMRPQRPAPAVSTVSTVPPAPSTPATTWPVSAAPETPQVPLPSHMDTEGLGQATLKKFATGHDILGSKLAFHAPTTRSISPSLLLGMVPHFQTPSRRKVATISLRGRAAMRRAIIYQTVLAPPRALRPYGDEERLTV